VYEFLKSKKSPEAFTSGLFRGDGGSRTRVQTDSNNAFYKLSFQLIVGNRQGENHPTNSLFLLVFEQAPGPYLSYRGICDAPDGTRPRMASRGAESGLILD